MTDRPILFSGAMVRAILDGRKSMTRRVIKPPYGTLEYLNDGTWKPICTRIFPGDRLWVREAWAESDPVAYRADYLQDTDGWGWRPSIHMPRWASRLTLTVTDVRVQRVRDINGRDIIAEGVRCEGCNAVGAGYSACRDGGCFEQRSDFVRLWNSLNDKRGYGWDANPWVCAISFDVRRCNIDNMESRA